MNIGRLLRSREPVGVEPAAGRDLARLQRFVDLFEQGGRGWFWETGVDGSLTYASDQVCRAFGCQPEKLLGSPFTALIHPELERENVAKRSLAFYLSSRTPFDDVVVRANTGDDLWWSISGRPLHDASGRFFGFHGITADLTAARRSEVALNRLARYDSLTGLANRATMQATLEETLWSAVRRKERFSVFLLDLDRFKGVNDTLGHPVGDMLLKLVAQRLRDEVGTLGEAGRLGGDEFQVVFPGLADPDELQTFAHKIITALSKPYFINGHTISVGCSIGIAVSEYDERTAADLVRDADLALYAAKEAGRGTFTFFKPEMHKDASERQSLDEDLRAALANNELSVVYQPSVSIASEQVTGFEALVRWTHPVRGPVSPAVFIPLAEEAGLIHSIGEWVLRTACTEAAKWPNGAKVAVNLSPLQFSNPSLPTMVARVLATAGLRANQLELEITEGALLAEDAGVDDMIARLKTLGVKLALDDFGTGYSSLGYLRRIPFDKIKIDQSFVRGAANPASNNAAIIRAIVGLATDLGMETTAEGVETHDELALVRELGCTLVQGYIYGKPMAAENARELASAAESASAAGFQRYRPKRQRLIRMGSLQHSRGVAAVRLRDVSAGGAQIECAAPLALGEVVTLDLSVGEPCTATVRWVKEKRVGISFAEPFDLSSLATLSREIKSPTMVTPEFLGSRKHPYSPDTVDKKRLTAKDLL